MTALNVIELENAANLQFSVIWLHGLGASADDFVPVVKALNLPSTPAIRFIFPNAPQQAVTVNGGYIMPAWYDILEMSALARKVDSAGILRSVKQIEQLIVRENQRGISTSHIFLAGFSQ
ncbi:MAG: carboxylesterase, partial [Moraxellaceae bacterium]